MAKRVTAADEVHFVSTSDGWRLAVHRYHPRTRSDRPSVMLCGGFSCNRYFMDYEEPYSLARYLAARGFDAWVVELRGRGLSHPTRACARPGAWTFDHLANIDVPAVVQHVAETTGRQVTWVGHSMGGMVLYAYLGCHPEAASTIAAGVTIASPVVFPPMSSSLFARLGQLLLHIPIGDLVRQRWLMAVLWHLTSTDGLAVGMNPSNIDRAVVGPALRRSLSDVSRLKLQQFARWALQGEFTSVDRAIDYRAELGRVRTPLLVVAGSYDQIATPASVRLALEHLPSGTASYQEFGRAHGHSVDYGHVDLILGRMATNEVFPALNQWLGDRA